MAKQRKFKIHWDFTIFLDGGRGTRYRAGSEITTENPNVADRLAGSPGATEVEVEPEEAPPEPEKPEGDFWAADPPEPTLQEIAAAGYSDPQAVLDEFRAEKARRAAASTEPPKEEEHPPAEEPEAPSEAGEEEPSEPTPTDPGGASTEGDSEGDGEEESPEAPEDLSAMTKAELRSLLDQLGVEAPGSKATHADLAAAVEEALAEQAP